ncbi:xanthine dehydrogenase family protein molybdopterin-binding subunit [Rhodococcus sp. X156]|uniref:xanthine dehydrogenase family protein molybdopterin-binding subunit n=1 Tax=Rhodococcus sp. X156 TaxID=2499145 RepID=UPI000FDA5445|nr:xanthine dehydrogenase family protein molybdopterin-binding subunit [Rhodococcus sp. X156]
MTAPVQPHAIGTDQPRVDGVAKVTGSATYAYEHPVEHPVHLHPLHSTIARGRITAVDTSQAEALPGVLTVLTHLNAPRLADTSDAELAVLQTADIAYRGQLVGAVIAETPEVARHAASLVHLTYHQQPHDTVLHADRDDFYTPESVNGGFETDTDSGDVESALREAAVTVDATYSTPTEHNNPMEPHTTVALWNGQVLTLFDSTQGVHTVRTTLAPILGLDPEQLRVVALNVGGGFGSKGMPHPHNVLAAMGAQVTPGRAVKMALTRQEMFTVVGYRTPTIQRVRYGADADGHLTAIVHEVLEQSSTVKEFAEQTAVPARMMYACANRRTSHRVAALDVAVPSWMRAPGECPGMYATEAAMDELAAACGLDPIELRVRNEPEVDPETGKPWSQRRLLECLYEGARRIGWSDRAPQPRARLEDGWWVGLGVSASTYPHNVMPGSHAKISYAAGRYSVQIGAVDIGTGAWTALAQIAADALRCPLDAVDLQIGDSALPMATVAGGSSGTTSWGTAITAAAELFRHDHGEHPEDGVHSEAVMPELPGPLETAIHSFGAQLVEVRVHADTGEVRVPRMVGVFSVGRVVNPRTVRSQLIGGMTMGLSMALHEQSITDPRFGHVVNHDFAEYHIAAHGDVADIDVSWLDEHDPHANPMGTRGVGEIGIVGTASAIVSAVHHATGTRVRDLPVTADKLLE